MERRGGFQYRCRRHAKSNSASAILLPNNSTNNTPNTNNEDTNTFNSPDHHQQDDSPCMQVREQDQFLPIANVIRIMRRILPPHAKISDDAKETIQECVSEFISFITGEANERCQREQRKTVTAEDLLWAMAKLGFDDYVEPLNVYLNRYREAENERGGSSSSSTLRGRDPKLPLYPKRSGLDIHGPIMAVPPPFGPSFPMGHLPGMFDAAAAMTGYYRDHVPAPAEGSSPDDDHHHHNALASYDPFVPRSNDP
ncbi:hypothetical protein F2P56_005576 [Juglans regia]|uniref:Nuclear transcription factor Y subunit B-9-like n=2 Tax=Juglans regia TaxID=51240 RepID=A0A2I4E1A9_JUGRE|nr:nuclear transcription factor Y subunit B-9-like [Juglans regia]KAF5479072.1 hypothetical protein F2P56_005576 [Juglans regia]